MHSPTVQGRSGPGRKEEDDTFVCASLARLLQEDRVENDKDGTLMGDLIEYGRTTTSPQPDGRIR